MLWTLRSKGGGYGQTCIIRGVDAGRGPGTRRDKRNYYFSGCDPIVAPLHVTQTNGTSNPATEEDMIFYLVEKGLDFTPNTGYSYSNIGYLVLGEIIEEISNQSYEDYVQSSIFDPLGISGKSNRMG